MRRVLFELETVGIIILIPVLMPVFIVLSLIQTIRARKRE